jgi:hypothetical protein
VVEGRAMPSFLFEVQCGKYAGGRFAETSFLCDEAAAWAAAVEVCSDLLKDVVADITPDQPDWRLTVSDEAGHIIYCFHFAVEITRPARIGPI